MEVIQNPETEIQEPTQLKTNTADAELEEFLSKQQASIKVIGTGGGGNNTINRVSEVGILGTESIAINTDAQDLLYTTADKKLLIGKDVTKGLGAGSKPKEGEKIKIDFCKLKTQDKSIVDGLLLNEEPKNFKNIEIIHEFVIEKIVMPSEEELNEKGIGKNDFAKIREMAKRQGKIIRKVVIDGNESTKEKEFVC